MPQPVKITVPSRASQYEIKIGSGLLPTCGSWARKVLGKTALRIAIVSDPNVYPLYGMSVEDSLTVSGFETSSLLVKGGEARKDLRTVAAILDHLSASSISRTDAVLSLGGGVVGDIAGFAASAHLRGVRFLNIPTTLLAMIDASTGGKTGVNSAHGKNLIGAFHQPSGVLVDPSVLATLQRREMISGYCEAIKQGAVGGRELLDATNAFLEAFPLGGNKVGGNDAAFRSGLADLIARHVAFKAEIVSGDPQEASGRKDARSRKILNFGHTLAHALEKVTGYRSLRHGEAVGYGILFAAELSKTLALCKEKDVKLLNDVVHRAGTLPALANIDMQKVFEAFRSDKKNTAGSLQMVLLRGIGKPVIVDENDIPPSTARQVLRKLLTEWSRPV